MTDPDQERTTVKTYLPRYQKERWQGEADEFSMSLSEYVRCMVQAGRHNLHDLTPTQPDEPREDAAAPAHGDAARGDEPGGDAGAGMRRIHVGDDITIEIDDTGGG